MTGHPSVMNGFRQGYIMKKITYLAVLASTLLFGSSVSADWVEEQAEIISNHRIFDNLKETVFSPPESSLEKAKYESQAEFDERVKKTQKKIIKRFFLDSEIKFEIPDNSSVVEFVYKPFEEVTISEDIKITYPRGKNGFGVEFAMISSRGNRQLFRAEEFETRWPYSNTFLSIDRGYLQQNNSDVRVIRIVDIDINDPSSFELDFEVQIASTDQTIPHDKSIQENIIRGKIVSVGLYDFKNKEVLGVFSSKHDLFYYLYNNKLERLAAVEINEDEMKKFLEPVPIYVPEPVYPRRAQSRGKEGYAVIGVTITTAGDVRDPMMVEESPEGWGFGRSALKAAKKLQYDPLIHDGVALEVFTLFRFEFRTAK